MLCDRRKLYRWLGSLGALGPALKKIAAAKPYHPLDEWSISPFPNGHSFAFTIIHDADDAYSRRLAPIFETFDELEFKITATAFMFWGEWADNGNIWRKWKAAEGDGGEFFAPKCVPLIDKEEREFYINLAVRGHEIGMHTPSDTSSPRADVTRAFELFKEIFGRYPAVYAEHRVSTKKDAQANEGSRSGSRYYNTDLLNFYGPWVWIDDDRGVPHNGHAQFYDILAANGTPLNHLAARRYGIKKAFLRTGKWREGDGDGFLNWYSEANIDALEKNHGLALVYTHLDKKWLASETRKTRPEIRDRLNYLASKNGWFVPAGTILDRVQTVQKVKLHHNKNFLRVVNTGIERIEGLTLISNKGKRLYRRDQALKPTRRGEIVVGLIQPAETLSFNIV